MDYVFKPPENAYIKQIFKGFSCVPGELGLKVGLKHKKINISNSRIGMIDNILKIQNDVKPELEDIHLGAVREVKEKSGVVELCLPFFLLGGNVISLVVGM
ncbi:uncharacterized protein [Henckelia pumila]|uniref:uncharacterized protein isoform X3 n=1 Tax=Henckelia pumila TaxID=405737 RepID=UPI003C6E2CB9